MPIRPRPCPLSAAFSLRQPGLQQEKLSIYCLERQVGAAPGRLEPGGYGLVTGAVGSILRRRVTIRLSFKELLMAGVKPFFQGSFAYGGPHSYLIPSPAHLSPAQLSITSSRF